MYDVIIIDEQFTWTKAGRGKRIDFALLPGAIETVLLAALPFKYVPYELLCTKIEKIGKRQYQTVLERGQLTDLARLIELGYHALYIRSEKVTPNIRFESLSRADATLSMNGLICVQWAIDVKGTPPLSSICVVDKVVSVKTGERRAYQEYAAIFNSLRTAIKKHCGRAP